MPDVPDLMQRIFDLKKEEIDQLMSDMIADVMLTPKLDFDFERPRQKEPFIQTVRRKDWGEPQGYVFKKEWVDNCTMKVVMDLYPNEVRVLVIERAELLLIDWTSINPKVIESLRKIGVKVGRRHERDGHDYWVDIGLESVLRLHMAMQGQKMKRVRAPHGQLRFKRRHTNGKTEASSIG